MRRASMFGLLAALLSAAPAWADDVVEDPGRLAAVQKRRFRLDHEIFAAAGFLPWDAFYKGVGPTGSYTWHFGDLWGWEVLRGGYVFRVDTGLKQQLLEDFPVPTSPTRFEEIQYLASTALVFKPAYGKLALMNDKVLHGEIFGVLGGSLASFTDGSFKPGPELGLGARLFLNEWISWRADGRYHLLFNSRFDKLSHVIELTTGLAFNLGGTD